MSAATLTDFLIAHPIGSRALYLATSATLVIFRALFVRSSLVRGVALDRHPQSASAIGVVVPHGVVLGAAVVPERDRSRLPLETTVKLRLFDVLEEQLQQARLEA